MFLTYNKQHKHFNALIVNRCGQGTESSTPTPAAVELSASGPGGAAWGDGELEDGLMDELGEQGLAVHALAEADQSQGGSWL